MSVIPTGDTADESILDNVSSFDDRSSSSGSGSSSSYAMRVPCCSRRRRAAAWAVAELHNPAAHQDERYWGDDSASSDGIVHVPGEWESGNLYWMGYSVNGKGGE